MVFVKTWDETVPAGSEAILTGDDRIREFKYGIRERLAVDHNFKATEGADANIGRHNQVSFIDQVVDIAAIVGATAVYGKTIAGKIEIFLILSDSTVVQLTSGGKINVNALSGIIPAANLGTGTPGATNFLRGDGAWTVVAGGVLGTVKNLKVDSASNTTFTASADEIIVEDSSNNKATIRSLSLTVDCGTVGAAGLDSGSLGNNIQYYVWAISKSSDGTKSCIASTSSTAPTLPTGYDQKALIGYFLTDGSAHILGFRQEGKSFRFKVSQALASGSPGSGSWTSIDITKYVPSALSTMVVGILKGSANQYCAVTNDSSIATGNTAAPNKIMNSDGSVGINEVYFNLMVLTANTIYYLTGGTSTVYIDGFDINKL